MVADFIIAFCAIGILICAIYIIYQAKKLKYEKTRGDYTEIIEEKNKSEVYASIEENDEYRNF